MNIPGVPEEWQVAINKLLIDGSVLDLCCGSGRFYPLFQTREYTGVDKDPNFAKTLSERWPEGTWTQADVVDYVPDKQYDNIFTWVALQHIRPEDISRVAEMMKAHGGNIMMCERMTGGDPGDSGYLWKHDYAALFPGMQPVKQIVENVWLMHWVRPENFNEAYPSMAFDVIDPYTGVSLGKTLKPGVRVTKNGKYYIPGKGFIKKENAYL